ncbi:MAG: sugar phosphate isomerase/epimerase [Thermosynechococcaceae cyanobacterium]
MYPFNICSATLGQFPFEDVINIAAQSDLKGIELKVHPNGHKSIDEIEEQGAFLRKQLELSHLEIPVLNSYVAAEDFDSVDRLIECAHQLGAQKIRLVLPKTLGSSAYLQAAPTTIIPSYKLDLHPIQVFSHLRGILGKLEKKARQSGISFLFELHWGTIMSSFSAAYLLLKDFDPNDIAVTFDPANMIIEGKEDWEYGIALLSSYIQNVHVKNAVWHSIHDKAYWHWSSIQDGYLNWPEIISILTRHEYHGDYAIEDFLLNTQHQAQVVCELQKSLSYFMEIYNDFGSSQIYVNHQPELQALAS